jgi:hypothetical protein
LKLHEEREFILKRPSERPIVPFMETLKKSLWYNFDGVAFFSVNANHKLKRINGHAPSIFDKACESKKNAVITFIEFLVILIVIL